MTGDGRSEPPAGGPALEIVAGHPSAEELAALTVALSAVLATHGDPAAAGPDGRPGRASGWADRSRMMRFPPGPAPDAWRRSARPR
jgi:hypothetical protein